MDLNEPRFAPRDEVFAERSRRPEKVRFAGLWLVGSLRGLAGVTVAVVGSRAPSHAAARRAHELGRALVRAGVCVISGLALGVDGSAHAGALAGEGLTLGVLGGGHRRFFPRRNLGLARDVLAAGGAVLSPYPPDEPARRWQFLERNGVVAALADAVVIVEAAERSGALNTASWASDLGIDVLVYPGDVDHPKAAGCNSLIRDGATLVRHPADVLGALGLQAPPEAARSGSHAGVAPLEAALERALARGPAELEALVESLRAPPGELLALLVRLELAGRIERRGLSFAPRAKQSARVKIRLIAVGKLRESYVAAAAADFRTRLRRYDVYDEVEVAASPGSDPARAMRDEGARIVRLLEPGEPLWLLERTGNELSSSELSHELESLARSGHARLTLAIAGTYGASEALLERADFRWSLSRLTLLHEWARALVLEQLYRAAKIARNEPYHH